MAPPIGGGRKISTGKMITRSLWTDEGCIMHIWQLKILVVGALGGRFDHEAANIDVLHTFANVLHIVLLSEESSLMLLAPGYLHKIHINCSFEGPHCGLIPLGAPSTSTTTTGLHWNLSKHCT